MIEFDNDRVYEVIVEDCVDGDADVQTILFRTLENAQKCMNSKIITFEREKYGLPLQCKGKNFVSYYEDGFYNDNHYDITIFKKEIN